MIEEGRRYKVEDPKTAGQAKLEGAKQNLSRVFDILEEVTRQVNSLKRQAAKAKRYDELKTEMIVYLGRSWRPVFSYWSGRPRRLLLN